MKNHMKIMISTFIFTARVVCAGDVQFRLGIENFTPNHIQDWCRAKKPCRMSLITNQTGKDQFGRRNIERLLDKKVNLKYLLAPEHGLDGITLAEKVVENSVDQMSKIPIMSLYGHGTGRTVDSQVLNDSEVLLFDIQDSGMRHYTYISTMLRAMEAAAEHNKTFVVFDRPNPLGGVMEGPLVDSGLRSFISIAPIPVRHGMTVGELARFFNQWILKKPVRLFVVPMNGYKRLADHTTRFLAPLSPNIASRASNHGYSFLGLLGEIQEIDVGVGSDLSFQVILLPKEKEMSKQQWSKLAMLLRHHGIMSTPLDFYSQRRRKLHGGLRLAIADINQLHAFGLFLDILEFMHKEKLPLAFSPFFDKAVGTSKVRELFQGGMNSTMRKQLEQELHNDLVGFAHKAQESLLYKPYPYIASAQKKASKG